MAYNQYRFGSPFENGLSYHLMNPAFQEMADRYGIFSIHYIPINFFYDYLYYPLITLGERYVLAIGGSLFLLSPLFFAGLFSLWQDRYKVDTWILFSSIIMGNIPALMVMAPGSLHFGPRYLLDIVVPLLLLTASGIKRWPVFIIAILVGISAIHYLIGSIMMLFCRCIG